jgi:DNA-binding NtrC family response regulator
LDEIGELTLDNQAKLLRVLQEGKVTPVGSHDDISIDVRTIAATNKNLAQEVKAGRFRLDLYYRLNVLTVEALGLRDRVEDIEPLVNHFLAKTAVESGLPLKIISGVALKVLQDYEWPGNVRELQNLVERAVVMTESETIGPQVFVDMFSEGTAEQCDTFFSGLVVEPTRLPTPDTVPRLPPDSLQERLPPTAEDADDLRAWMTLAQVEEAQIRKTLRKTYYNQSAAARLLGVDRKLLSRKIKKYRIELSSRHQEAYCRLTDW